MPCLLKEQRGRGKGDLRKENDKPQFFTKEIMLLLVWSSISKKRTVVWQAWLLYFLAPFKKENLSPEARRGDRPVCLVSCFRYLLKRTQKNLSKFSHGESSISTVILKPKGRKSFKSLTCLRKFFLLSLGIRL